MGMIIIQHMINYHVVNIKQIVSFKRIKINKKFQVRKQNSYI